MNEGYMMRKNNNGGKSNNYKNRQGGGGGRRYGNSSGGSGGGNRSGGGNDSQNLQRQKHHATQQLGKYNDLARNAHNNGDRVDVEYYLQHVDHYTRVLADIAAIETERFAHQREQQQQHHSSPVAESTGDAAPVFTSDEGSASGTSEGVADLAQNDHQPRMTRHRQPRHQAANEGDHNGAKEANSNTNEIPLPDNILPPI